MQGVNNRKKKGHKNIIAQMGAQQILNINSNTLGIGAGSAGSNSETIYIETRKALQSLGMEFGDRSQLSAVSGNDTEISSGGGAPANIFAA
jgi:hypothetical protein